MSELLRQGYSQHSSGVQEMTSVCCLTESIFPAPFLPAAGVRRGQVAISSTSFPRAPQEQSWEAAWILLALTSPGYIGICQDVPPLPSCPFCLFCSISRTAPALVYVPWATSRSLCATLRYRALPGAVHLENGVQFLLYLRSHQTLQNSQVRGIPSQGQVCSKTSLCPFQIASFFLNLGSILFYFWLCWVFTVAHRVL